MLRVCHYIPAIVVAALLPWSVAVGQGGHPQAGRRTSAATASDVARQVLAIDEARRIAMLRADARALDTLLAPDASVVWGDGTVDDGASTIALVRRGRLRYSRFDYDSTRVRVYGQAAVVAGRAHVRLQSDGQAMEHLVRVTRVYARERGRWRLVAVQTTRADPTP